MGVSSGSNTHNQPSPNMLPPRQFPGPSGLHPSLFLAASVGQPSMDSRDRRSNSDHVRDSPAESASSQETWPTAKTILVKENDKAENDNPKTSIIRRFSDSDKISLRDIASERVEIISERMQLVPDEFLDDLKNRLRAILDGSGGSQQREEFMMLQKLVQSRSDLTAKTLIRSHRVQLEIIVAINTGILAFLHPNVSLSQTSLIEVFVYKRCRNIACQNQLPADDCTCELCLNRKGFCNLCMCVVCNRFDFEVNTCRWIGCDVCSHWTHTDCAIRNKQISMGSSSKIGSGSAEMVFHCRACNRMSELLGWVKDVFQHCAPTWDREALMRELDFVSRIFRGSEDPKGRKLFLKCEELVDKLKNGITESLACRAILLFFQELEMDSPKNIESGEGVRMIAPHEACNKIADVVHEAVQKMEMVADEKMRLLKKARLSLEVCDRELEDKAREVTELKLERHRKKQQIDELESIVRLKQAEADMFQLKADEARREAEMLQSIALARSEKSEEDYASRYLKQRLSEAEAERQYIFEKIKLQEGSHAPQSSGVGSPSQAPMLSKIQDLLKNVYSMPPNSESQPSERLPARKYP